MTIETFAKSKTATLLLIKSQLQTASPLLLIPNGAGIYAKDKEGPRQERYFTLCEKLSEHYDVFIPILSGQDIENNEGEFSFWQGAKDIADSIESIYEKYQQPIDKVFAMCAGPALLAGTLEVLKGRNRVHYVSKDIRIILYNAPAHIPWDTSEGQNNFLKAHKHMRIDREKLMRESQQPADVIHTLPGNLLCFISEYSDYKHGNMLNAWNCMTYSDNNRKSSLVYLKGLSDVPGEEQSPTSYSIMLEEIKAFFARQ